MSGRRATLRHGAGPRGCDAGCEWVGGRFTPPFFVTDREEPYRVTLAVWMELPDGLIVGQEMAPPEESDGALGRALVAAMRTPLCGPPRRPGRIRIADPTLAAEVRAAAGDGVPVTVAPTPELDEFLELMVESMPGEEGVESYLENGRIPPAAVAELFATAEMLYRIAPWTVASDGQVLRMDIPALDVEGACISVIGALGENLGIVIFPSMAGYESFIGAAEGFVPGKPPVDIGTGWLALTFERGAELPAGMRREVAAHGWRVADLRAYPVVERRDRDGARPPLVERDVRIAAACASALTAFFVKHHDIFACDEIEPVCESYTDRNDLLVRFTVPYDAFPLFDVADEPGRPESEPAPPRPAIGRNAPSRAGAGRSTRSATCRSRKRSTGRAPGARGSTTSTTTWYMSSRGSPPGASARSGSASSTTSRTSPWPCRLRSRGPSTASGCGAGPSSIGISRSGAAGWLRMSARGSTPSGPRGSRSGR